MADLERDDEGYLVGKIEELGGLCLKLVFKKGKGFPDRTIIIGGLVFFVELKRSEGGVLSPQQVNVHARIARAGRDVHMVVGREGVDRFLKYVTNNLAIIRIQGRVRPW